MLRLPASGGLSTRSALYCSSQIKAFVLAALPSHDGINQSCATKLSFRMVVPRFVTEAAEQGDVGTVEAWLDAGGGVNSPICVENDYDIRLVTAAIIWSRGAGSPLVDLLTARGARCAPKDLFTALSRLRENQQLTENQQCFTPDAVRMLVAHGADAAYAGMYRWTAMHKLAVIARDESVADTASLLVPVLIACGASVNAFSYGSMLGGTPLAQAAFWSSDVYLRQLVRHGADPNAETTPQGVNQYGRKGVSALARAREVVRQHNPHAAISSENNNKTLATKQACLDFLEEFSSAGTTWKRFVAAPRLQLLVLRKLCEGSRATAPSGVLERLFSGSLLPDVMFWKVLSYWRTSRDVGSFATAPALPATPPFFSFLPPVDYDY